MIWRTWIMNHKRQKYVFSIEKKLAAIEWNLKLLKASAEITHTPLRTLKSMVQTSVIFPTHNLLREIVNSQPSQKERLARVWRAISWNIKTSSATIHIFDWLEIFHLPQLMGQFFRLRIVEKHLCTSWRQWIIENMRTWKHSTRLPTGWMRWCRKKIKKKPQAE